MVNLSDLSGGGGSSSSSGTTKVQLGYGGVGTVAHYVLSTRQTSSTGYGFTFYDQDFGTVAWGADAYSNPQYQSVSHWQDFQNGTFSNPAVPFDGYNASQNQVSSSSTYYLNSFQHNQWGGFAGNVRPYSTGAISTRHNNSLGNTVPEMKRVFNSDHSNKGIAYMLYQAKIKAVCYDSFGTYNDTIPYPNTEEWTVPGCAAQHDGTASYNKSLKKLFVIRSWSSTTATYNCYSGVDFDAYPSPAEAMTATGVTVVTGNMLMPNIASNSESQYRIVPVLCDDGTLWCLTMYPSNGVQIWGRTAVPTSDGNFTPVYIGQSNITTSYGYDQGQQFGRTMLETRDRKGVLVVAPYYYYGGGCVGHAVPKSGSSTNHVYTTISLANSSNGVQPLPWRDDGFCFYYAGNGYASNYTGSYLTTFLSNTSSTGLGGFAQTSNDNLYLPYYGSPNTTNYPGMSAVVDYDFLSYNNGAR